MHRTKLPPRKQKWIVENYGSRRGLLRTWKHRVLSGFGKYKAYSDIEWERVERLVFVCQGNICRSAFAESVAKAKGVKAVSCGIDTVVGAPANAMAIEISAKRGYDLSAHHTKPVQSLVLERSDLLVAMEPWQAEYLQDNFGSGHVCTLLGLWSKPVTPYIHDPYGSSPDYFDKCFTYIEQSVTEMLRKFS